MGELFFYLLFWLTKTSQKKSRVSVVFSRVFLYWVFGPSIGQVISHPRVSGWFFSVKNGWVNLFRPLAFKRW